MITCKSSGASKEHRLARFHWKLWPRQVTGNRKYGTEDNLIVIENQHIHAYIPLPDNDHRDFRSLALSSSSMMPNVLSPSVQQAKNCTFASDKPPSGIEHAPRMVITVRVITQCLTSRQDRSLCRSVDEEVLDRVGAYQPTGAYKKVYRKRSVWIEPLFAFRKEWQGMRRLHL